MAKKEETLVLVADDEPSMLALVSAYVKSKGFKVIEASDGDQAWQLAHDSLPDLVILDVMMPGMSGWEVCRKIREAVSLAHTGVIMLTGIGENLNEMTSPLYGADTYIDKPFEFTELEDKIDETLAKRSEGVLGRADEADREPARRGRETLPKEADDFETAPDSLYPGSAPAKGKAKTKAKAAPAVAPKKTAAKKAPAKKQVAKKAAKKAPAKPAKKAAKKAAAKKAPAKKQVAKKAPAKPTKKKAKKK